MDILIFGIDGLGKESLEGLGLKRLAARMHQGKVDNPTIQNVISRGWPELYTGKHAFESGGFYQSPAFNNNRIYPTQNTGLSAIKKNIGEDDLLWNVLNRLGYKVGLFTVPTVTKPEEISGFCIAATGAGKFGNGLASDDIHPSNLLDGLQIKDIDLGFRMGYGAFIPKSIEDLEQNANKHIADYFYTLDRVLDRNSVDICFAASRFINEMGYKFLGVCLNEPKSDYEIKLKQTIMDLCESFDAQLDNLINRVNPKHLFIVSDHGIGKFKSELNLNQLLLEIGEMTRRTTFLNWREMARSVYVWLSSNILNKKMPPKIPKYRIEKHKYFSIGFTNVLYLNDQRFGAEFISTDEALDKSKAMVKILNEQVEIDGIADLIHFEVFEHGGGFIGKQDACIPLPNIHCKMSSGLANTERCFDVICKKEYGFETMFERGFYGEHSGCKTEDTLSSYSGSKQDIVDLSSLTNIYNSIINLAKVAKS